MVYFSPVILWNKILQTCLPGRVPSSSEEFSPSRLSPGVRGAAAAIRGWFAGRHDARWSPKPCSTDCPRSLAWFSPVSFFLVGFSFVMSLLKSWQSCWIAARESCLRCPCVSWVALSQTPGNIWLSNQLLPWQERREALGTGLWENSLRDHRPQLLLGSLPSPRAGPSPLYTAAGAPKGRVLCQGWCYEGLAEVEGGQLLLLRRFWSQRP